MALEFEEVNIQAELDIAEKAAKGEVEKTVETLEVVEDEGDAKTEKKAEVKPEEPAKDEKTEVKKVVPLSALHEARRESKELKEQLRRKETEDAERYSKLQQRLDAIQNPPPEKPVFESDPANFLKAEVDDIKKQTTEMSRQAQKAQIETQIKARLQNSEQSFSKEHPDYFDAASHVMKVMSANMELMGVTDQAAKGQAMTNEVYQLTIRAVQAGKEPAELIYELAKNQGFVGKVAAAEQKSAEKLESIAKGQEASASLGSGSRADAGKLTLDSLAKMDDDDFNALVLDEKKWAQIGHLMH